MDDGRTRPGILLDDRFLLARSLGGGGAATVWLAKDLHNQTLVALKLLHPKFRTDDTGRKIIQKEANALFALAHPSIAQALVVQLDKAQPYIVLEYVEGTTLAVDLRARTEGQAHYPVPSVLAMFKELSEAVGHAHQRGIVHRDLKPPNIMLTGADHGPQVKVLDFGVAKMLGQSPHQATTEGRVQGSIAYMSPEQSIGTGVDARTDVFALGCMLFEVLTLRRCWIRGDDGQPVRAYAATAPLNQRNHPLAVMERIASGPRPEVSQFRPELPKAIDLVVKKALEPHHAQRYANPAELWRGLAAALPGPLAELELSEHTDGERPQLTLLRPAPVAPEEPRTELKTALTPSLPVPVALEERPSQTPTPSGSGLFRIQLAPPAAQGLRTAVVFGAGLALGALAFALAGGLRSSPEPVLELAPPRPAAAAPSVSTAEVRGPQVTALPTPAAPPPPESAAAGRRRLPAANPSPAAPPPVAPVAPTLESLLAAAKGAPLDSALLRRLRDRVEREADQLSDRDAQARVRRMVSTSAMIGDLEGVEKAILELRRARSANP